MQTPGGHLSQTDLEDPHVAGYIAAAAEVRELERALTAARTRADAHSAAMDTTTGPARGRLGRIAAHLGMPEQTIKNQRQRAKRGPRIDPTTTGLVTACATTATAAGRAAPTLRDHRLGDDERAALRESTAQLRAALDHWIETIETAADTGQADADSDPARPLGE